MKKLLLFAAATTMFVACSKDTTQDLAIDSPIDKLYVSIGDDDSRVQLNENRRTVWTEGDRVSVFNKTTGNRRYKFTGQTGDRSGELSYMNGGTTGDAIDKIVAMYPYNYSTAITADGVLSTTIPANQTYCKDSYGTGSSIMVARSNDENLLFKSVMGWIRLSLTGGEIVKTISLKGLNDEPLAGNVTIAEDLSVTFADDAVHTLTLDCGDGVQLTDEPTDFYIAIAPQTFCKGFYAEAVDADNNIIPLTTFKSITVQRNHIVSMAQSELKPQTEPLHNQIWYTTSDNSTITPQNYNGNIISNTYTNGKGVITFDCTQTAIGEDAFKNCTVLKSITIPNSVTSIGDFAFYGCAGLTRRVTIPNRVTKIGNSAFKYCTGLTSVTIPGSVTSIGYYAFEGCTGLDNYYDCGVYITDIAAWCAIEFGGQHANPLYNGGSLFLNGEHVTNLVIPNNVTSIRDYVFCGCTSLRSVKIGNCVTSIGNFAFKGCIYMKSVTIPDSITEIGGRAFEDCTELTSVTIPGNVTSIRSGTFSGCTKLKSINIPDSVTSIGEEAFKNCI